MIKISLTRIYGNKPYYTIKGENGSLSYALGYEQIAKVVEQAGARREKIELEDTKFMEEHSKLIDLLKSQEEKTK